jgi:cell division protein FtsZ
MQGPVIRVIGVGNGGCNAVSQIQRHEVAGVELFAFDTDVRKLNNCPVLNRLALGRDITNGLGAGGDPEVGRQAAEASQREIEAALSGAHMVFVTAAMGGGTGTGAAPVICRLAKELGALTVAVCTKPFRFERQRRLNTALEGIQAVAEGVDAVIVIDNQRLFEHVEKGTRLTDAFAIADDVLRQAVQGVSDLITIPGTINVDFADVCAVLRDAGPVLMGMTECPVNTPSSDIVQKAVASPLLENGIAGASNLLLNVTIGPDSSLWQVHELADAVAAATGTEMPNVIFGTVVDDEMLGRLKLTILAASFTGNVAPQRSRFEQQRSAQPTGSSTSFSLPPRGTAQAPALGGGAGALPSVPPPPAGAGDDLDMPTFVRRERERREGGGGTPRPRS